MNKFKGKKTDNTSAHGKVQQRLSVLSAAENKNVIEFFCGSGYLYNHVWKDARSYIGIDIKKQDDDRATIVSDCALYASQHNMSDFDIIDIDAYGSPYGVLAAMAGTTFSSEFVYFCVTDGLQIDLRMGKIEMHLLALSGVNAKKIKNAHLMHDLLIKSAVNSFAKSCGRKVIELQIKKGMKGSGMRYYTFCLSCNTSCF